MVTWAPAFVAAIQYSAPAPLSPARRLLLVGNAARIWARARIAPCVTANLMVLFVAQLEGEASPSFPALSRPTTTIA